MTIVRPAKTAVRLPELEKNGEGGQHAGKQSGSGKAGLQQVMRLGFRGDESVYIDITRYFFMTTTY